MNEVDYIAWIEYLEQIMAIENASVKNILELACGTGNITLPLAIKGYDIVGMDISEEMLNVAVKKSKEIGVDIVYLEQDIRNLEFEVDGLDCVLCCCDGFNYILKDKHLKNIFTKVYYQMKEEGIFIFDISSYYKLTKILGDNTYGEEKENITYMWQNFFNYENNTLDMDLVFFVKDENGKYDKFNEYHTQRAYKENEIANILREVGFSKIKTYGDFSFEKPKEDTERITFVCKK
jgi:ubiquinone/menaquinone biosynthesis C-methylase UbiE